MSEEELIKSGYKRYEVPVFERCDRFYQKKINDKEYFNVYYYDTFKENGAIDYDFEFERVEERDHYWYKTFIWGLDKSIPYTIEEIERILLNKKGE